MKYNVRMKTFRFDNGDKIKSTLIKGMTDQLLINVPAKIIEEELLNDINYSNSNKKTLLYKDT